MIPRGRIDIGWMDLAAAAVRCLVPASRRAAAARVERLWSPDGDALACLSVRSGLDRLLAAMDWPPGSEVLVSAVTIRDMIRVIEGHGLVAVPVDLDLDTLTVPRAALETAVTPNTRAVLVAHLFGSRMPLHEVARFARERGLLLIEDCAQSFTGLDYRGAPESDVSMFSFGPIKTCTALGGALLRIKDPALRARVRAGHDPLPVQGRRPFLVRVVRFALLRLAMGRLPYTVFCGLCRLLGDDHDRRISRAVRGFSGPDFFTNIRRQPSAPLLALLFRRLSRFDPDPIARRHAAAERLIARAQSLERPGRDAACHSYWTFPVLSDAPDDLVRRLWHHGFDATRGTWSLFAVPAPAGHPQAAQAAAAMRRIVYVPIHPRVSAAALDRLAEVLTGRPAAAGPQGTSAARLSAPASR
jgi:dTDP-4-amino-4,6-dideoxygalactose transaminase